MLLVIHVKYSLKLLCRFKFIQSNVLGKLKLQRVIIEWIRINNLIMRIFIDIKVFAIGRHNIVVLMVIELSELNAIIVSVILLF